MLTIAYARRSGVKKAAILLMTMVMTIGSANAEPQLAITNAATTARLFFIWFPFEGVVRDVCSMRQTRPARHYTGVLRDRPFPS